MTPETTHCRHCGMRVPHPIHTDSIFGHVADPSAPEPGQGTPRHVAIELQESLVLQAENADLRARCAALEAERDRMRVELSELRFAMAAICSC